MIQINETDVFDSIDISDFKTVKRLILKRMEIYSVVFSSMQSNFLKSNNSGGISTETKEQLLEVYEVIDEIVGDCNFKDKNMFLLELLYSGYTISEVCKLHKQYKNKSTAKSLDRMVKKINKKYTNYERSFKM